MGIFLENNVPWNEGGGLTSKIIPKRLTGAGIAVGMVAGGAASLGKEMLTAHNRIKAGPIKYTGGPARMTHNVTSGAVEAIQQVTNDPEIQADMLKKITKDTSSIMTNIEEFGIDGDFVSAFYGMG